MSWKTTSALALAFALVAGCDENKPAPASTEVSSEAPSSQIPDEKEIREDIAEGTKDALAKKKKWTVEYEGDLSGKLEGSIMSVVSVSKNTTIAGAAMTDDRKGKANRGFMARVLQYGEEPVLDMNLTLEDGTKCKPPEPGKGQSVTIENAERKTFAATMKGELVCGDGKKIKYVASVDKGA